MILLELAMQIGLQPKKEASSHGGEYSAVCPACPDRGENRFRMWPNEQPRGRYWCRRCGVKGDSIQFCKDFLGTTFREAKERIGEPLPFPVSSHKTILFPTHSWQEKAEEFCESAYRRLLIDPEPIALLKAKYGLTLATIERYRVGWNPEKRFQPRSEWGLDNPEKKVCLPRGLVISDLMDGKVSKLKIRDLDWKDGDPFGKYRLIPGSSNQLSIIGLRSNRTVVVVESEFDAILLTQEIGEFCTCVALGGASNKPDPAISTWLKKRMLILYSLDCDAAGRERYDYWRSNFPNLRAWQSETRKSPADSFVLDQVDLCQWFEAGVRYWSEKMS